MPRSLQTDAVLAATIQASSSLADAARQLGLGVTTVRQHAQRLGVRTQFRYGREKLPSDAALKVMLKRATMESGMKGLGERLGVCSDTLYAKARELGVSGSRVVRPGLPDDLTLWQEMYWSRTLADTARRLRVADYVIRNEARRLQVAPSGMVA